MKKWEYKNIECTSEKAIRKLGEEGWEMCGTVYNDKYNIQMMYFKRETVGNP